MKNIRYKYYKLNLNNNIKYFLLPYQIFFIIKNKNRKLYKLRIRDIINNLMED